MPGIPVRRILVVDDNVDSAESLTVLLQVSGHDVCAAHSGDAALAAARDFRPDVVLLDIGMPGMDGHEVARRLREEHRDLVLVAVTGYGLERDRLDSKQAGFDHHLVKPVDPETLRGLLASLPS